MQRAFRLLGHRPTRHQSNNASSNAVSGSKAPPPPPPPEGGEGEGEGEGDGAGVGALPREGAHAVEPALAGAVDVAELEVRTASAVSIRPWSSVTVTLTVTEPATGATRLAIALVGFRITGGFVVGAITVQANEATA